MVPNVQHFLTNQYPRQEREFLFQPIRFSKHQGNSGISLNKYQEIFNWTVARFFPKNGSKQIFSILVFYKNISLENRFL